MRILAATTLDFLVMIAVGYDDLCFAGGEPFEPDSVAGVAGFREWVSATFEVEVPAELPDDAVGEDEFTAWVAARQEEKAS